jgi:hypothetical protein
VRLTAETFIKYFVLTLESNRDLFSSDEAVQENSKIVFDLYKKLLAMDRRYGKLVPSLQRLSNSAGFNVQHWFLPFVYKWLDHVGRKSLEWVDASVQHDSFQTPRHSSSISDVFTALYEELDVLVDLKWTDEIQNAAFMQKFAQVRHVYYSFLDCISMHGTLLSSPFNQ